VIILILLAAGLYFYRESYKPLLVEHVALQDKYLALQAEHGELLAQEARELEERSQVAGEAEQRKDMLETCLSEKGQLEEAKAAAQKQASDWEQQLFNQKRAVAEVQEHHNQTLQDLQNSISEKDQLIQELQTRLSRLAKDAADKQEDKKGLARDVEQLKTALEAARAHAYMLEQERTRKQEALEAQREEGIDDLKQKDDMIQRLQEHVQHLEHERAELRASAAQESKQHAQQQESLSAACDELKLKVQALEKDASAARESAEQVPAPVSDGSSSEAALRSRIDALSRDKVALNEQVAQLTQAFQDAQVARAKSAPAAPQQLAGQDRRMRELEAAVASLEQDKARLLKDKQVLSQQVLQWRANCGR
jgi:chromosome segregation ATPase